MQHFQFLLCFLCLKLLKKEQAKSFLDEKKAFFFFHGNWKLFFKSGRQGQCESLKSMAYCDCEMSLCWKGTSLDLSPC